MVQVVRLDAAFDQRAHQRAERLRIVVDAGEQHRLAQHRDAGVDQPRAGLARGLGQFARMVGVQHHIGRLALGFERPHELRRDAGGIGGRHAAVHADHLDVRDRREPRHHLLEAPRGEHQRIAAGQHDLPDLRMRRDVAERAVELLRRQRCGGGSDHLAAEAEAAIHRADVRELEQHAVGIAVHDAFDRAVRIVADRVGAFLRPSFKLGRIGHELPRDRIVRVGAVDQLRHGRRDGDGILRGDLFQRGAFLGER